MKKYLIAVVAIVVLLLILGVTFYLVERSSVAQINSFEGCAAQGFPVMESFPRQCRTPDGRLFVEEINNGTTGKEDLIVVLFPTPGEIISSPLLVQGRARGTWFFEASFPVKLFDAERREVPLDPPYIMATENWMTEDFVPFNATLTFSRPQTETGFLVLYKDNPSGLPQFDDKIEIPVRFGDSGESQQAQCRPTGCSSQVCSEEDVVTTCEFKPEYACYKEAVCERQADGECGWTETTKLLSCLASN